MRFNCKPSFYEKHRAQRNWHRFYPIWPRRVKGVGCVAFEWIERRLIGDLFIRWEYRLPKGKLAPKWQDLVE